MRAIVQLEFKELLRERVRRARLEAAKAEMLVVDSSKPEVKYVTKLIG